MCLVVLPLVLPLVLPDWLQYQLSQELYGKQQDGQKVKVAGCFQQKCLDLLNFCLQRRNSTLIISSHCMGYEKIGTCN